MRRDASWFHVMVAGIGLLLFVPLLAEAVEIHPGSDGHWKEYFSFPSGGYDQNQTYAMSSIDDLLLVSLVLTDDVVIVDTVSDELSLWPGFGVRMTEFIGNGESICMGGSVPHYGGELDYSLTYWELNSGNWRAIPPIPAMRISYEFHGMTIDDHGRVWATIGLYNLEVLVDDSWLLLSDGMAIEDHPVCYGWNPGFGIPAFVPTGEVWLPPWSEDSGPVGIDTWSTDDLTLTKNISYATGAGKATDYPGCIYTDSRGITWIIGSHGHGPSEEREQWLALHYQGLWVDIDVNWAPLLWTVCDDAEGNMWFATEYGLLKLAVDDLSWHFFPFPPEIANTPNEVVMRLYGAETGKIYVMLRFSFWSFEE